MRERSATAPADVYKPSVIRGYEQSLRLRLLPAFGRVQLREIHRADVQAFVDRLLVDGMHASTIRNTLLPLRTIPPRAGARRGCREPDDRPRAPGRAWSYGLVAPRSRG